MYKIMVRDSATEDNWTDENGNYITFETEDEAWEMVQELRRVDPRWAEAHYRVVTKEE
jgi:hypothetical protein